MSAKSNLTGLPDLSGLSAYPQNPLSSLPQPKNRCRSSPVNWVRGNSRCAGATISCQLVNTSHGQLDSPCRVGKG